LKNPSFSGKYFKTKSPSANAKGLETDTLNVYKDFIFSK